VKAGSDFGEKREGDGVKGGKDEGGIPRWTLNNKKNAGSVGVLGGKRKSSPNQKWEGICVWGHLSLHSQSQNRLKREKGGEGGKGRRRVGLTKKTLWKVAIKRKQTEKGWKIPWRVEPETSGG